jgi:hypothetical protein
MRSCKLYWDLNNHPAILKLTIYFLVLPRLEIYEYLSSFFPIAILVCLSPGVFLHLNQN